LGGRGHELRSTLSDKPYGVVTLHRASNVDVPATLRGIARALEVIAEDLPLVFPMHPRTKARCTDAGITFSDRVRITPPLSYMEFLSLWRGADVVLTDSGGVQEETTALGVRCVTLRDNTERPVTLSEGSNRLAGVDPQAIIEVTRASRAEPPSTLRPRFWDGKAAERITRVLANA
jgi:UDP-N-acetylglucosamine 2-epimerase (non-hydrolysing)